MSENIGAILSIILSFLTGTICIVYLVVTLITYKHGKAYTQKNIMFRAIASIVLFILFSFEVAIDIVLNHSAFNLGLDIICTVLWAIIFFLILAALKSQKTKQLQLKFVLLLFLILIMRMIKTKKAISQKNQKTSSHGYGSTGKVSKSGFGERCSVLFIFLFLVKCMNY